MVKVIPIRRLPGGRQRDNVPSTTLLDLGQVELKKAVEPLQKFLSASYRCQHTPLELGDMWKSRVEGAP